MKNQQIDACECEKIRGLDDFDLEMLVSDIHDHGWPLARITLALMPPHDQARASKMQERLKPARGAIDRG